jgi:hypothetical protein
MLGIYPSPQRKIEEGLEYLRIGLEEKNEAILIITDELTKDEIRNEIIKKWNIPQDYLTYLEKNAIINIKKSRKFYFSTNIIDRDRIAKQYSDLAYKSIEKGKRGLRTFGDMKIFFEIGYEKYVIEFEKSFQPLNDFPMTGICAYDLDDFVKLDQQSRKILFDHHNLHLTNNLFRNIFDESSSLIGLSQHICMYYQSQLSSRFYPIINNNLLRYIGEGLQREQVYVYLSMNNLEKDHPKMILSQIPNLKNNQEKNFMIIENSDNFYINAACDNLKPFEDLKKLIFEKAVLGNKKDIRIISDIQDFLFKNKHFDQCVALEEWWDQTIEDLNKRHGLNVLLVCLYNIDNFQNSPFTYHRYRINDNHSIICDVDGIILSKDSKFDLLTDRREKNMERGER